MNRGGYSELWLDGAAGRGPAGGGARRALALPARRADLGDRRRRPTTPPTSGACRAPQRGARARRSAASTARGSCGRSSLSFESFDGRRIPYFLLRRRRAGRRSCAGCTAAPSRSSGRRSLRRRCQYLVRPAASRWRPRTCAARPATARPTTTWTTSRSGSTRSRTWRRSRAARRRRGTPVGVMGGSYGGYMTMAAITEQPELWAGGGQHRRHRQLRHLPRAHRRVPARAARGRVRLARARPRVPRVDLADPQDRPHRAPLMVDPRRQRPARAGRRGRAGRGRAAGPRRTRSSTCATRTRATASRAWPTGSTATRAWRRSSSGTSWAVDASRPDLDAGRAPASPAASGATPVLRARRRSTRRSGASST